MINVINMIKDTYLTMLMIQGKGCSHPTYASSWLPLIVDCCFTQCAEHDGDENQADHHHYKVNETI